MLYGDESDLDRIRRLDKDVDKLHGAIVKYLGRVSREELTAKEMEALYDYLNIATAYENIGDVVETDLVHSGRKRITKQVSVSPDTQEGMRALADQVVLMLERTTEAVDRGDRGLANEVIEAKDDINALVERVSNRLVDRLIAEDPHRTATYRVESQLVENYKRIYYFTKRIAKTVAVAELLEGQPEPENV